MAAIRSYIFIDQLQPKTMCYLGSFMRGYLPRTGMAALVVEVASTNDRRRQLGTRVRDYLNWGAKRVWIIDPVELLCFIHCLGRTVKRLSAGDALSGDPLPAEFRVSVSDLFAEPKWWRG